MASPRRPPPPPPAPKSPFDLEITVVSAKHLKNVNWRSGDLKPYAVAYLDPDRRSATKPDDSGSTRPVWNERLTLPLPLPDFSSDASSHRNLLTLTLTLDIFHSKPSETPKPLVGTARVPLKDLLDVASSHPPAGPTPIRTLELRRPSGRPHGKVRIKVSLRERPPPPPAPEQSYQLPGYYYSTAPPPPMPPPPSRDYRSFSPPPPPLPHYTNPSPMPSQYPYSPHSAGGYSDPYSGYYSSGAGYYSAPPAPMPARPMYYDRPANYGGPSAPADYSPSSYEQQKAKGPRMGMGTGLAVGAVAGALGGLALEEGANYEEEKIAERVESGLAARDDYSDYRADY